MLKLSRAIGSWALVTTLLTGAPLSAQTTSQLPPEAARRAAHGMMLAEIGRSGLRSLLSASGNLGDLQNRGGSYRMAEQMERARTGPLHGRISALEVALANPGLPVEVRAALAQQKEEALAELVDVPRYDAAYRTLTGQAEALVPTGFLRERPMFMLFRGRVHRRWGGTDGLTVSSEGATIGPVFVISPRWIVSPGLNVGRTDVDIAPFDGESGTTAVGPRIDVGHVFGDGWSAAAQLAHGWSWGDSRIMRPGPDGPHEVRSESQSRSTSAKVEVRGRVGVRGPGDGGMSLVPRAGLFLVSTHTPSVTNSLGETGAGPFGERETQAALRAGTTLSATFGRWSPSLFVGWERELTPSPSTLVEDPTGLLLQVGLSRALGQGRRLVMDYGAVRGASGLRRVSEFTLVLILDG